MPVDLSGVHQIIQAWIAGDALRQRREQFSAKQEQDMKMQENLFKQQKDMAAAEHDYRLSELAAQQAEMKRQHKENTWLTLVKGLSSGELPGQTTQLSGPGIPKQLERTVTNPEQIFNIFGERYEIPGSVVRSPEEMTKLLSERAGSVAGAQANAQVPSKLAVQQPALQSREYLGELAAATHLLTAMLQQQGMNKASANEIYALAHDAATGNADLTSTGASLHARAAIGQAGLKPFEKKQATALQNLRQTEPLYDSMVNFYDKYIKGNEGAGALWNSVKANIPLIPTDIKADFAQIKGQAGQIAKTIGGESGRLTESDIDRAMGLLTRPNVTDKQAQDILQNFKSLMNSRILDSTLGQYSPAQQKLILQERGFDLNQFSREIDGKFYPVFRMGEDDKPIYLKNGAKNYDDVEDYKRLEAPETQGLDIFSMFKALGMSKENKKSILDTLPGSTLKKTSKIEGFNLDDYATDPNWENGVNSIRKKTKGLETAESIDQYIKSKFSDSPITGQMVLATSKAHGVPVDLLLAIMQHESHFGTVGRGARTFNPGNVGNFDNGKDTNMQAWDKGVDAIGKFLAKRRAG